MSNVVAIPRNEPTLDELAVQINTAFELSDDGRIQAGERLLVAYLMVAKRPWEPGNREPANGWYAWITENVKRSAGDCRAVMAIANSDDPKAALEAERARKRENGKRKRDVERRRVPDDPRDGMPVPHPTPAEEDDDDERDLTKAQQKKADEWEARDYPEAIEVWLSTYEGFTKRERELAREGFFSRYMRYGK